MAAGLTGRPIAHTRVALAPVSLVGLLGAALLAGALLGGVITYALDSNGPVARTAVMDKSFESPALIQVRAGERESAALGSATDKSFELPALIQVRAGERASAAQEAAPHAQDHIGLMERLIQ